MTEPRDDIQELDSQVGAIIATLQQSASLGDVKQCLNDTLPPIGYAYYTYLGMDIGAKQDRRLSLIKTDSVALTNLDPAWTKRYVERRYLEQDPVAHACYHSRLPVIWSTLYSPPGLKPSEQEMLADAAEHGICRGITIPVHGFAGELGILSLYSLAADDLFLAQAQRDELALQRMAFVLHDVIHGRFVRRSAGAAVTGISFRPGRGRPS